MTAHSVSGKKRTPPRARHGLPGSRAALGATTYLILVRALAWEDVQDT